MNIREIVVFLIPLWNLFFTNAYVIKREATLNRRNRWVYRPDVFIMPSSVCSDDELSQSSQCTEMGGSRNGRCKCICNAKPENSRLNYKGTFGFFKRNDKGQWQCFENSRVHDYGGCSDFLDGINPSRPLRVIPMATPMTTYNLPLKTSYCGFQSYEYLKCDGSWESMYTDLIFEDYNDGDTNYFLKYSAVQSSSPNISGRIVKIRFECYSDSSNRVENRCVLFKVNGSTSCPPSVVMTTPSSLLLYATAAVSSEPSSESMTTISTVAAQVASLPVLSPSPPSIPTRLLSKATLHWPLSPSATPILPTVSADALYPPSDKYPKSTSARLTETDIVTSPSPVNNREKGSRSGNGSSSLIAGALSGVAGLAIIILIIVIIRKRKQRKTHSRNPDVADNAGYGRGVDNSLGFNGQQLPDEEEYSYAYNNAAQFVKTHKQDMECHTNTNHEPGCSMANHIYGQTDELNQMACEAPAYNTLEQPVYAQVDKSKKEHPSNPADAPFYNTLGEPEYAKVDKSLKTKLSAENYSEPLYNVLEGPETDEEHCDEPPSYQVLEGPFSEGAPVYDVLEGPQSDDAPVYGVLEGQDPHVYGVLDIPDNQEHPDENRGYDDMVYDSVGNIINDQGDIYQELNQSCQRNSDVYQALNYPENIMHLNELNQSHSNA